MCRIARRPSATISIAEHTQPNRWWGFFLELLTTINYNIYIMQTGSKLGTLQKAQPTKIAGRLSHHGLIQLLIQELLKRRNMAWPYFLFWNGFVTGLQPEEKGKSPAKKSSTPRSGKRKRRAISPVAAEQPASSSKAKKVKRNLDFSEKGQEVTKHSENILNLPYSDLEEE